MTADELAEQLIQRYGMPSSEGLYRALLAYAFTAGKVEGAQKFRETFRKTLYPAVWVAK
jgi:hypothetical protein